MAEDILKEMEDDFDDDSMEDILDDALEDSPDEIEDVKNKSSKKKILAKRKGFLKHIFGSKKAIIIIVVSLVLLMGLVIGAWLVFFKESPKEDQDVRNTIATQHDIQEMRVREDEVVFEDIIDLEPFEYIQLKAGSTMALISMNLSLELTDHRFRKQVYTMEDRIRKIIIGQVEEMTWLALRNPEGKIILKYNLLKRINSIFPKPTVRNIYFTYFIMQ
ncbi:MAG: flagellar basal body-associated FliL family protein [Desulfobacula sp.]|uniref:flagellar basal body-associated FliL family protein n=1 Tax=Desulfobacula sp. TaxID=2593537 RepID=UPI0025BE91CE|nr:flagellar basal body-associated FliL family protein [Desulfobacula sp.]MCD4722027.1 flagellar basal body-associated FliL family protein [Desulfobacula sp.]